MSSSAQLSSFSDFSSFFVRSTPSTFSVVHVNIRSLRKYWSEFEIIVASVQHIVDVFVLTEINVHEDALEQFSLTGYAGFFRPRANSRGGGIAVYVRSAWAASRFNAVFDCSECLALTIDSGSCAVVLLAFYRPPSVNVLDFLNELETNLSKLALEQRLCLVGDFNIDLLSQHKSSVCDYLTLLSTCGLESLILAPTREELFRGDLVISCIDHIHVRVPDASVKSAVVSHKLADHYFVACQLTFRDSLVRNVTSRAQVEIVDRIRFDRLVSSFDWHGFIASSASSTVYSCFISQFSRFAERSKRIVTVKRRRPDHPWLTADVLAAVKYKEVLWARCRRSPSNLEHRNQFIAERNRVNAILRSARRRYYRSKFSEARLNMAQTWNLVNELRGTAKKASIDAVIERHFSSASTSVADSFNNVFASVSGITQDETVSPVNLASSCSPSAYLPEMTEDDLRVILFSFKASKAPGTDNIRIGDLRRNFEAVKEVLLYIFNSIINSGKIPIELKTGIVRPLYKGGAGDSVGNYRPISILPCMALVLEKHIFKVMSSFIDEFSILSDRQYGFVAGRGTHSLLDDLSDVLYTTLEHNQFACALFLDVSKAFDSISHKILLKKLFDYGFRGPFYSLLENFLTDRSQRVSVGNVCSSKILLKAGVPQGSVLSPLLFNLYVNDLPLSLSGCDIFQYADDTLLLSRHLTLSDAVRLLQVDSCRVMDWFSSNAIKINIAKTKLVCFRSPLKRSWMNLPVLLHGSNCCPCTCRSIQYVDSVKYLGIYFDSDMTWNTHLAYTAKRLRSVSCLLYNTKHLLPFSVRRITVNALAYGVLRYGITVFGNCTTQWKQKIDAILKAILKSVAYNSPFSNNEDLFKAMRLPTFSSLFFQTVILRYYWDDTFLIERPNLRSLRMIEHFSTPRIYTNYGKGLRSFYVPDTFNKLPEELFDFNSKRKLNRALKDLCALR